jgi:hypothetical protein
MSAKISDPAFRDHDVVRRLDVGSEVRSKEALRVVGPCRPRLSTV